MTVTAGLLIARDITETVTTRQTLALTEARLRAATETARSMFWIVRLDGGIAFTSQRWRDFTGITRSDIAIGDWLPRIHPEDREKVVQETRYFLSQNEPHEFQFRACRADGAWHWLRHRAMPVLDARGSLIEWAGFITDVTDIHEAEARFRTLVDAMPQMAFIAGPDGQIEFFNRQWTEYAGTPQGTALDGDYIHPDDAAATMECWNHSLATGDPYTMEHRLRCADGGYRWFLSRAVPLRDRIGNITKWFGTSTDISDIVAGREATARSHAELERLVADRTRALTDAARELVSEMQRREEMQAMLLQTRKLEALGQLTGGVAHDFNNVLAAIMGSFGLIRRRTECPEVLTQVERGEQAADKAAALVRQLLSFARKQQLRPQVLDVQTVVMDTDTLIAHAIGRNVTRCVDIPSGTWPVLADPQQLEVALLNLAVNARDAMPDGGAMTITARNLPAQDRPRHLPVRDYIAIGVRDTGHGMPQSVAARATEPFFTTKEPGKGTGLGLAMVHGFAEHSGGCLRIDSQEGQGTLVEIILTRGDQDATQALDPTQHGGATILVVEDDEQIRSMTAGILRDLRYTVIEARNAEVALALVHTLDRLDLVITDIVMPGADGPTLVNRLRSERPSLPVLFLTGFAASQADDPVLRKPVSRNELAAAVLDCLFNET